MAISINEVKIISVRFSLLSILSIWWLIRCTLKTNSIIWMRCFHLLACPHFSYNFIVMWLIITHIPSGFSSIFRFIGRSIFKFTWRIRSIFKFMGCSIASIIIIIYLLTEVYITTIQHTSECVGSVTIVIVGYSFCSITYFTCVMSCFL